MTAGPLRRDRYLFALMEAAPGLPSELQRAVPVAIALCNTARADGTRASLSAAQLARLYTYGDGRSDSTARRHIRALTDAGWLTCTQQGGRRGNKVYASIYSLSQPLTQMSGWDDGPSRSPLTLQPLTQMSASSPQERTQAELRPPRADARSASVRKSASQLADLQEDGADVPAFAAWAGDTLAALGAEQTAALVVENWTYDIDRDGAPATGDPAVDELLWHVAVHDRVSSNSDQARWTLPACRAAVGRLRDVFDGDSTLAWCALYRAAAQGGRPDRVLDVVASELARQHVRQIRARLCRPPEPVPAPRAAVDDGRPW